MSIDLMVKGYHAVPNIPGYCRKPRIERLPSSAFRCSVQIIAQTPHGIITISGKDHVALKHVIVGFDIHFADVWIHSIHWQCIIKE